MSEDALFEEKLCNRIFGTAYDPITRRYMRIIRVNRDGNMIRVIATRFGESVPYEFAVTQLTKYAA